MEPLTFFMGSYTEYLIPEFGGIGKGIYTVQLNTETGELSVLHTQTVRNPSYLALSDDHKFLYCSTELDESEKPRVKAFRINSDCSLQFINEQPIEGGYPCHIVVHEKNVLLACYATGNVIQYPLEHLGSVLPVATNQRHSGSSVNKDRQEAPHAHQVTVHPNNKDIYVCDLGIDTLKAYEIKEEKLRPNINKDVSISEGGGPRHMVFNPSGKLGYVINELTGKVSVLQQVDDVFKEVAIYNSLPADYSGTPSASAIRLHPNGKFLFVANRGAELLTIFKVHENKLLNIEHQYTHGEELREFNITPDGKWLIACHQNSYDTVVYRIKEDGKLEETYRTKEILSPVCIVFLNQSKT
ncbi:lactonase family protein [Flagellimonas nanhaiensis]|uniref:Lactonase family protein n=1 Tax=Flagellimonas nanhaiensis TaxID=2292706 RepID=A0A371JTN7_9FLAO|nr:lactonase family protein [Allomuricauda nanhaiensis]RDY61136.1 lactonase family protein [Allomuricauda nanhaiensis]